MQDVIIQHAFVANLLWIIEQWKSFLRQNLSDDAP